MSSKSQHETSSAGEKLLGLAEAQLLGFFHAKRGFDLRDLVTAMGLTAEEWEKLQELYGLEYIPQGGKEEISLIVNE